MKQVFFIAAFIAFFSVNTTISAQNQKISYFSTGMGLTNISGLNAYMGGGFALKNNWVLETDVKMAHTLKNNEGDLGFDSGDMVKLRCIAVSLGKTQACRNGFGVVSAGLTYGYEKTGRSDRFLMMPFNIFPSFKTTYNAGLQLSARRVFEFVEGVGFEVRGSYNINPAFSGVQVSGGLVVGSF